MRNLFVILGLVATPLASQANVLKYVYCQYGNAGSPDQNSLKLDLDGRNLSNLELSANGLRTAIQKLGSAFAGEVSGSATSTKFFLNYADSSQNTVIINARGAGYKWSGTIEVHIPAPRADGYQSGTKLDQLLEGQVPVECHREVDDEG